jgi:hypothetical protein
LCICLPINLLSTCRKESGAKCAMR